MIHNNKFFNFLTFFLTSFFFLKDFFREYYHFVCGRIKYSITSDNYYLLRRNIHRLEKGLSMPQRKPIFALEFIEETVNCFQAIVSKISNQNYSDPQIKWAYDVLNQYFKVVSDHPTINKARKIFNSINLVFSIEKTNKLLPYLRNNDDKSVINYVDLLALAKKRKSVRWFLDKPVDKNILDKAIELAGLSPSGCNRQSYRFIVINQPEMINKILNISIGTSGFGNIVPVLIVVVGEYDAFVNSADRHLIYIDASLALMTFMLALETLGLSSCMINWPDIGKIDKQIKKLLSLKSYEKVVLLNALGYSDNQKPVLNSSRKNIDRLRNYY